jgi:hypothetical protein
MLVKCSIHAGHHLCLEAGNKIAIKFHLGTTENIDLYSKLTKWLRQYGNIESIKEISDVAW